MVNKIKTNSREEWLELRKNYIGGSDAGAVIGTNPYMSKYTLWAEKTGKIAGFEGNLITEVGSYLEDFVAKLFERETGKKVRRDNQSFVNDMYPFALADIDRSIVGENALLEIKTTSSLPIMKKLRNSDEFPDAYYAQVVHYLAVTGYEKAYLAVLINCREFKMYELERDQAEIDALMKAEEDFWFLVKRNLAPEPDGTESTSNTLSELYPESSGANASLNTFESTLREYMALSEQVKALTELKDAKANIVKEYMKDAAKGESDSYKVSFASSARKTFDSKAFAAANTDIDLEPYYKSTTVRTFRVTEKNEK